MSTTIIGLIIIVASQFVPADEIEQVMTAIGVIVSWYGRIRLADVSIFGFRK